MFELGGIGWFCVFYSIFIFFGIRGLFKMLLRFCRLRLRNWEFRFLFFY